LNLLLIEFWRSWIFFRRYPISNIAYIVITFIVFYGLFLGTRYLAGPVELVGSRLDAFVVGYIVWSLSLSALADISINLQEDMQSGTLEHVYLSPYGPTKIYLARGLARLVINLGITLIVGLLIMVALDHWLRWRPLALPVMLVTLASAYGFSLFFGGLTLLYKRVGGLFGLVQFLLLYLVLLPVEDQPFAVRIASVLLPIAPTVGLLRQVLSESGQFEPLQAGLALGNALIYVVTGLLLFRKADQSIRASGTVNQF